MNKEDFLTPVVTDYNSFGDAVARFNLLAGNLKISVDPDEVVRKIRDQALRVREECQETIEACEAYLNITDYEGLDEQELVEEILDGVIDVNVTGFGLLQIAGPYFDTQLAATKICQNNLSKFTTSQTKAEQTVKHYAERGVECFIRGTNINGLGEVYSVIRTEDGKVMKPYDYVDVDLSDCIYQEEEE